MTEERVEKMKQRFMSAYDVTADGRLQIQEVQHQFVSFRVRLEVVRVDSFDRALPKTVDVGLKGPSSCTY